MSCEHRLSFPVHWPIFGILIRLDWTKAGRGPGTNLVFLVLHVPAGFLAGSLAKRRRNHLKRERRCYRSRLRGSRYRPLGNRPPVNRFERYPAAITSLGNHLNPFPGKGSDSGRSQPFPPSWSRQMVRPNVLVVSL